MTPIDQLDASHTAAVLEAEKQLRDDQVKILRAEMFKIHKLLEPKWESERKPGPPHLAQKIA